jgi:hypothetical protein
MATWVAALLKGWFCSLGATRNEKGTWFGGGRLLDGVVLPVVFYEGL